MDEKIFLTSREAEVLSLLANGNNTKQIGYALGISNRTVMAHLFTARKKVGAETRSHLVHIAHQKGILK